LIKLKLSAIFRFKQILQEVLTNPESMRIYLS